MRVLKVFVLVTAALAVASLASAEEFVRVSASVLRMRAGPGTGHEIVGLAREGQLLKVLSRSGRWVRVDAGTLQAWVHGAYVVTQPHASGASYERGASNALDMAFGGDGRVNAPAGATSGLRVRSIPRRPASALGGQAFLDQTASLSQPQREARILQALTQGDVPAFLRRFREVRLSATLPDGRQVEGSVWVSPDYLAIGSDSDFVRVPMNPLTAQRAADRFGCVLPTRKIVDAIWRAAEVKLDPIPLTPSAQMSSNAYTRTHDARVRAQLQGSPLGRLVAGHKKDIVVSNRLLAKPNRVAIYGWHRRSGRAIQPLSTVHENTYADYSHGVRLVHPMVLADGRRMRLADALRDPELWRLFSDEGRMRSPRIPGA